MSLIYHPLVSGHWLTRCMRSCPAAVCCLHLLLDTAEMQRCKILYLWQRCPLHQTLHCFLQRRGWSNLWFHPRPGSRQQAGCSVVTSQFPQSQTGHIRGERRQRVAPGELIRTDTSPMFGLVPQTDPSVPQPVLQSRRRPLIGLLPLSHIRQY